jgi:guanosine-3',5'-bis(diphosphate) 3'-pyrophosphohydrolase
LHEQHQHPENIMPLHWTAEDINDISFTAYLSIDMLMNDEQISDLIYQCRKEKTGVEMVHAHEGKTYVHIVVHNRKQIAQIIRDLRMHFGFPRITRLAQPINISEASKAS